MEQYESTRRSVITINGQELHEGTDWIKSGGANGTEILYAAYKNKNGEATVRIEETSTGNNRNCIIAVDGDLDQFGSLPDAIRERIQSMLSERPSTGA